MSQIKIQNVTIAFSETLVQRLTFSLGEGDRISVVGNNGSGKTSLLRCVAGLVEPHDGAVLQSMGQPVCYVERARLRR